MFSHALKSVSWAFAGKWFQMLVGVATLAVTARILGPGAYGLFAAAIVVTSIGDMFVSGSPAALTQSLVQRREINHGHQTATFHLCLAVGGALWLGVTGVGVLLGAVFDASDVGALLPYCGAFLFINALGAVPFAVLIRDMRFKDVTLIDSAAATIAGVLGVTFAISGAGVWSLVAMELGRSLTRTSAAFIMSRWLPGRRASWSHLVDVSSISTSVVITNGLSYVDRTAPRILIATVLGTEALGFYTIAMRLLDILAGLFIGPFSWVAMPIVTRTLDEPALLKQIVKSALRYASMLAAPIFVGVAVVAPMLTPVALGGQWIAAIVTIQLIVLTGVRAATASFNGVVLVGVGHIWSPVLLYSVGAALTVVLVSIAAPYGVEAVAGALLARSVATVPLSAYLLTRATGIPAIELMRQSWPALGASAVMAVVLLATQNTLVALAGDIGALLVSVPLGAIVYVAAHGVFAPRHLRVTVEIVRSLVRRNSARLEAVLRDAQI
jgi:O-antigen/teichoic acid export membrane protein